jgi:hypothetical protein
MMPSSARRQPPGLMPAGLNSRPHRHEEHASSPAYPHRTAADTRRTSQAGTLPLSCSESAIRYHELPFPVSRSAFDVSCKAMLTA